MKLTTIWLYIMVIAVIFDIFFTIPRPCKKGAGQGNCWDFGGFGRAVIHCSLSNERLSSKGLLKVLA